MSDWHTFFTPTFVMRFIMLMGFWIACVLVVIRADKSSGNEFNMIDIVMENGRASKWSVIVMVAFGLSCVIMSGWFVNETLQWTDFLTFLGVWVTPLLVKMFVPSTEKG